MHVWLVKEVEITIFLKSLIIKPYMFWGAYKTLYNTSITEKKLSEFF